MSARSAEQPLVQLGFTPLEAEVYSFLLHESPVTGYRIAQALRKPAPNTYKAIESLELKGAVLVEDGDSRLCRPVPPAELLGHLERRFREHRAQAERLLSEPDGEPADDRVYTLRSASHVMERARRMLRRCTEVLLVDAFPIPLVMLRPELEAVAARGVQVAVKAYEPIEIAGARIAVDVSPRNIIDRWPGQWINVVADGREHLIAFLTADATGVHQAVWSGSAYISWVYHCALASEISLERIRGRLRDGATREEIDRLVGESDAQLVLQAPGYRELARRFADAGPHPRRARNARGGKRR